MEGIYLIHVREFAKSKEPIYKLGRSNNLENRVRNYPNGSIVLFTMKCKESIKCEKYLIKLFKEKFIQAKYYGSEYFKGNEDEMINEIHKYLYICNTTNTTNNNIGNPINNNINKVNEKDVKKDLDNNDANNNMQIATLIATDTNINNQIDKVINKAIVKSENIKKKFTQNIKTNIKENVKSNKNIINNDTCKICPNCKYEFTPLKI